ncbi:MAG: hypothetical protein IPN29_09275 [Saprospiraceae bacterium]|nr:hypothetical protein [Saprospiraceae bacterium]
MHNDEVIVISNGAVINMVHPNIFKVNPSSRPVIYKTSGELNLRGGIISQSPLSIGVPIQNSGGALSIEETVILKKQ